MAGPLPEPPLDGLARARPGEPYELWKQAFGTIRQACAGTSWALPSHALCTGFPPEQHPNGQQPLMLWTPHIQTGKNFKGPYWCSYGLPTNNIQESHRAKSGITSGGGAAAVTAAEPSSRPSPRPTSSTR